MQRKGFALLLLVFAIVKAEGEAEIGTTRTATKLGQVVGSQKIKLPSWMKESFLEITEDAAEAKEAGKQVILFFHAEGCPYCAHMMADSFVNAPYVEYLKANFDVIELDTKGHREVAFDVTTTMKERDLAKKLNVFAIPLILFLEPSGKVVMRVNGYWPPSDFKQALDYVQQKKYKQETFTSYRDRTAGTKNYAFLPHPAFVNINDLSKLKDKPVAVIFEESRCAMCQSFHTEVLSKLTVKQALKNLHVVRLDAQSETPLIDVTGKPTTAKQLARELKISYRPGVVFFDNGKEVARKAGMMKIFHTTMLLRYVGERAYKKYPTRADFVRVERKKMLAAGKTINVWQ